MAYIIINPNSKTLDDCILKTLNRHLKEKIESLEQVTCKPDFCIVQREEKGNIKIEQIKNLQKKLLYSPFDNNYQFGIIKDAQLMTPEAQNALLKTLEECPQKTIIILTVNNERSVLETILSRCIRIYPNKVEEEEFCDFHKVIDFLEKPIYEQINQIDDIVKNKEVELFLDDLTKFFREKHSEKINQGKDTTKESEILKMLIQIKHRIKKNVNPKIALEYACFKINHM